MKKNHIKNYIIGFLLVCIMVIFSFMYKNNKTSFLHRFPVENSTSKYEGGDPPLFIYIFFSKHNCHDCLEVISVLNKLPSQFKVTGIVPKKELENETELREITGAYFNLISFKASYKRFNPNYTPTIFGVGENGKIFFVLPGIPGERDYIENFLIGFYSKSLHLLLTDKKK